MDNTHTFRLEIVGLSEDVGRKILREVFPELPRSEVDFLLATWPRNDSGDLEPVHKLIEQLNALAEHPEESKESSESPKS